MARGGEGMGKPHARGIPWRFRHAAGLSPWPCWAQTGGAVKSLEPHPVGDRIRNHRQVFFLRLGISGRLAGVGTDRRAERNQPGG